VRFRVVARRVVGARQAEQPTRNGYRALGHCSCSDATPGTIAVNPLWLQGARPLAGAQPHSSDFFFCPLTYPPTLVHDPSRGSRLGGPQINSDKLFCMGNFSNALTATQPISRPARNVPYNVPYNENKAHVLNYVEAYIKWRIVCVYKEAYQNNVGEYKISERVFILFFYLFLLISFL
jgi:hypothetical protein